jgi:hypothetical protein
MNDVNPSPKVLEQLRSAAESSSPNKEFVRDLRGRLLERAAGLRRRTVVRGRLARGLALGIILLATACVLIVGPANVAEAVRQALSYIPGFGVVRSAGLRVLAEPVSVTRDGFTVTIDRLIADSEKTSLSFSVYWPASVESLEDQPEADQCLSAPGLVLPDGKTVVPYAGGRGSRPDGYDESDDYPALPEGVTNVVFALSCINGMAPGATPDDWRISLHLIQGAAPSVVPITPIATPETDSSRTSGNGLSSTPLLSMRVTGYSELEDGFLLTGSLRPEDPRLIPLPFLIPEGVQVNDASGADIPFEIAPTAGSNPFGGESTPEIPWALEIHGKDFLAPLTVSIDCVEGLLNDPVAFTVDLGPDPQPGTEWTLDRELSLLDFPLRLLSTKYLVQADSDLGEMSGLEFTVRSSPEIEGFYVNWADPLPAGVGDSYVGDIWRQGKDLYTTGIVRSARQTGVVEMQIYRLRLKGEWTADWSPE